MYYVCIENDQVTGVLSYEPNVPDSISVVAITDHEYSAIENKTHYFNVSTSKVESRPTDELAQIANLKTNQEHQRFLNTTDWKVMRHIREKALGIPTSLSEAEYLDLELERQRHAAAITH